MPTMVRSWKKHLETLCTLFLPGHGGLVSRTVLEREYARYSRCM